MVLTTTKKLQKGKLKFLGHRYDDSDNKGFLKLFKTWLAYKNAGKISKYINLSRERKNIC